MCVCIYIHAYKSKAGRIHSRHRIVLPNRHPSRLLHTTVSCFWETQDKKNVIRHVQGNVHDDHADLMETMKGWTEKLFTAALKQWSDKNFPQRVRRSFIYPLREMHNPDLRHLSMYKINKFMFPIWKAAECWGFFWTMLFFTQVHKVNPTRMEHFHKLWRILFYNLFKKIKMLKDNQK